MYIHTSIDGDTIKEIATLKRVCSLYSQYKYHNKEIM